MATKQQNGDYPLLPFDVASQTTDAAYLLERARQTVASSQELCEKLRASIAKSKETRAYYENRWRGVGGAQSTLDGNKPAAPP